MFRIDRIVASGKSILKITIEDIDELRRRIANFDDIIGNVDIQGMDTLENRDFNVVSRDVNMGLLGHIVVCDILHANEIDCELLINEGGFCLRANTNTIKIRSSFGQYPPCPEKQINVFKIAGYAENEENICDYYVQTIFCADFDLNNRDDEIVLYIIGGLKQEDLNGTMTFEKENVICGKISDAITLDDIMALL